MISRALALLLLLWPIAAAAQSPGWEEQLAAAERAWDRGQLADAGRLYLDAVKQAEVFGDSDLRFARSLSELGLFFSWRARVAPRNATQRGLGRELPPAPPVDQQNSPHGAGQERDRAWWKTPGRR